MACLLLIETRGVNKYCAVREIRRRVINMCMTSTYWSLACYSDEILPTIHDRPYAEVTFCSLESTINMISKIFIMSKSGEILVEKDCIL